MYYQLKHASFFYTYKLSVSLTYFLFLGLSVKVDTLLDDMMVLICDTSCPLGGNETFIWKRNGYTVKNHGNSKNLNFTRKEDGNYSCAIKGYANISSPTVSFCKSNDCMASVLHIAYIKI